MLHKLSKHKYLFPYARGLRYFKMATLRLEVYKRSELIYPSKRTNPKLHSLWYRTLASSNFCCFFYLPSSHRRRPPGINYLWPQHWPLQQQVQRSANKGLSRYSTLEISSARPYVKLFNPFIMLIFPCTRITLKPAACVANLPPPLPSSTSTVFPLR